jgi:hypothetical protein
MATLDALNERFGRDAVGIASSAKKEARAVHTRPGRSGARRGTPRGWTRSLWRESLIGASPYGPSHVRSNWRACAG